MDFKLNGGKDSKSLEGGYKIFVIVVIVLRFNRFSKELLQPK
jgi:hypothetical protein